MARSEEKKAKEPGRIKQMWQIFKMTRKHDSLALPLMLLALFGPIVVITTLAVLLTSNLLFTILWILTGLLIGFMLMLMTLTWRAERVAFAQIEGKPGAAGAVLKNGLRGSWQSSEMPVAVNTKTQDAVYRAVGKPGIVLIAEGPKDRTTRLVKDEQRKLSRIVPNVPIHVITIGTDSDLELRKLTRRMRRLKKSLTRPEVLQVSNRLMSLGSMPLPIPKGIDPNRVRAGRPR